MLLTIIYTDISKSVHTYTYMCMHIIDVERDTEKK